MDRIVDTANLLILETGKIDKLTCMGNGIQHVMLPKATRQTTLVLELND